MASGEQPVDRSGKQLESPEYQEMKRRKKELEDQAQAARQVDNQNWFQRLFGTKPKE